MKLRFALIVIILFLFILSTSLVIAQEEATEEPPLTIPNLVGLNVPLAVAMINQLDVALGTETVIEWNPALGVEPNTITEQSLDAGMLVTAGLQLDIVVARPLDMIIIFDDNDLTLLNQADGTVDLASLEFNAINARIPASFSGAQWTVGGLSSERCVQIWSVGGRQQAKSVDGCQAAGDIPWLFRGNADDHFWIDDNGATGFNLVQDGIYRGECDIIPSTSDVQQCELYVSPVNEGGVAEDVTEYVYFRYTNEQLWVINRSDSRWMPTSQVQIVNAIALDDNELFADEIIIGDVGLLAPHQCVLYSNGTIDVIETPENCDLIAISTLDSSNVFWITGFEIASRIIGSNLACVAPQSEGETVCLLPR